MKFFFYWLVALATIRFAGAQSQCSRCRQTLREARNWNDDNDATVAECQRQCRVIARQNREPDIRDQCNGLCRDANRSTCDPHQACTNRGLCNGNQNRGGSCNNRNGNMGTDTIVIVPNPGNGNLNANFNNNRYYNPNRNFNNRNINPDNGTSDVAYKTRTANYYNQYSTGATCRDCRAAVRDSTTIEGYCNPTRCQELAGTRNLSGVRNNCHDLCNRVTYTDCGPHQACTSLGLCDGNRNNGGSCNANNNQNFLGRNAPRMQGDDRCFVCRTTLEGADSNGVCKPSTCYAKASNRGYPEIADACNLMCTSSNRQPNEDWSTQACAQRGFC